MRSQRNFMFVLAALGFSLMVAFPALADNTMVLPKGRSSISLAYFDDNITREFDDAGSDRELGYQLNHVNITDIGNQVLLEQTGPLPFDILQSAITRLNASAYIAGSGFSYQYGVTDKLTVGVGLPYYSQARSRANFGIDVAFTPQAIAAGIDQLILANTTPIGIVQSYLHDKLGYDRIKDWQGDPGVGDLVLGAKYRFLNQQYFKSALAGSLSIPTGETDDERNLMDIGYGSGSYMAGLNLIADFTPVEWLTWSVSGGYLWDLPYDRGVFVLDHSNPVFYKSEFPTLHQFGSYDRGDYYTLETDLYLEPARGIGPYVGWRYMQAQSDQIDGDLMPKTARITRTLVVGLNASTVDSYLAKKAKLPMMFNVSAEPVQSGRKVVKDARIFMSASIVF